MSLEAHAAARAVASGAVSASTLLACLPAWLRETLVTDDDRHDAASLTAVLAALAGGAAPDAAELERLEA